MSEARTSLTLTRKWTVKAVDAKGVATLEMSITAMKNEIRKPDGTRPRARLRQAGSTPRRWLRS